MEGEKGISVKNIQYGIAACRTLAECRGLNAVGAAGVGGSDGGFFGLQQGGGLPVQMETPAAAEQQNQRRHHPELTQSVPGRLRLGIAPFASTRAKTYEPVS